MPEGYRLLWAGWYRLEDGAGPYVWDGASDFDLIGSGRGAEAAAGGAGLLVGETDGFATDFQYATDGSRVAVKTAGVVVESGLDAFYQNAGTSPKMVYDVAGVLGWSPHNMCLQSETFDNASWNKGSAAAVTANATTAPNAALTADKLTHANTSVTNHTIIGASISGLVVGQTYTFQIWAKAAEWSWIAIEENNLGTHKTYFNIGTGALGTVNAFHTNATITAGADGWYLCRITFTASTTISQGVLYLQSANGQGIVAGVVGEGVYLWGAQFNRGAEPTAYLPTTTAARYGLAVDYDPVTHVLKGLLCEPAATNLILNNATMTTQNVTVTAVTHTLSFFGTGTVTNSGVSTTVLNGTGANDRVQVSFLPTAGTLTLTVTGTVSRAQLEIGTVATSPIPTFAATATRAVDRYECTPASINYSATEGTWFARFEARSSAAARAIGCSAGSAGFCIAAGTTQIGLFDGTSLYCAGAPTWSAGLVRKVASGFTSGARATSTAGLAVTADAGSAVSLLAPGTIHIGHTAAATAINGWLAQCWYLPRKMSNAELAAETV